MGESKQMKNLERQQQAGEAKQEQQEKLQKQELLKRKLAGIRAMQGGSGIDTTSGSNPSLSQTIG